MYAIREVKVTLLQVFVLQVMWVCSLQSVDLEKCHTYVTDEHLRYLDEMIDGQMESSCTTEVEVLQKGSLSDYCYTRGLVYQLLNIITKHMNFKNNSVFANNTRVLSALYTNEVIKCVLDINENANLLMPTFCKSDKEHLTTIQILQKVKKLFIEAKYFHLNYTDTEHHKCIELHERECEEKPTNAGLPQCDCHSPTPSNLPRSTLQKPPKEISVFRRSTYASVVQPTTDSARDISAWTPGTYIDKSTGSSVTLENVDSSSFTFKDKSNESQFPQATKQDPYEISKLQSVTSSGVSPPSEITISQTITNFQGSSSETLKTTSETPITSMELNGAGATFFQVITEPQRLTESFDASTEQLHSNLVSSNSNKNNLHFSTNSFQTITPPLTNNELHFTNELPIETIFQTPYAERNQSPSPLPTQNLLSVSSIESKETSPPDGVTKMHRSIGTSERTFIKTTKINIANTPNSAGSSPKYSSHSATPQLSHVTWPNSDMFVSQEDEKKESNLGWADTFSTSASSLSPARFAKTEHRFSNDAKGSMHYKKTVHEGGIVHQNPSLSEGNVAARISQDRDSDTGGPRPGSNPLPIIETESKTEESHKMEKYNLIVAATLGILGILCLSGLLYGLLYKRKYQMLKRQLNREGHDPEIPEERPLTNQQTELELL